MSLFEEKKDPVIFEFGIDETAKAYILQTVLWTKFLAILSYIASGILFIFGLWVFYYLVIATNSYNASDEITGLTTCLFSAFIYLYPTIMLFKFSSNIKSSMESADQHKFTLAMKYQRNMYRYIGILIIVMLIFCALIYAYAVIRRN